MQKEDLQRVLQYLKTITASIVYEDPYDYSAGVKGAKVDYIPETIEELAECLGVELPEKREIFLDRPISTIDIETTGPDTERDRIASIAITRINTDLTMQTTYTLINPEMPIDPEATAVNGITNEMVKDAPTFLEVLPHIIEMTKDTDILTYNGLRFDLPLFNNECMRVGYEWDYSGHLFPDAMKIFHHFNKRDLSAAYKHYLGLRLIDAHNAQADTEATAEIFLAQLQVHPELPLNMAELQLFLNDGAPMADLSGKFTFNKNGNACYRFGKHKGKTVAEVLVIEPTYHEWVLKQDFPVDSKNFLKSLLGIN